MMPKYPTLQNWGKLQVKPEFSIQTWGKLQVKLKFQPGGTTLKVTISEEFKLYIINLLIFIFYCYKYISHWKHLYLDRRIHSNSLSCCHLIVEDSLKHCPLHCTCHSFFYKIYCYILQGSQSTTENRRKVKSRLCSV